MARRDFKRHIPTHALTHDDRLFHLLPGAQPDEILGKAFDRIRLLRLVAFTMPPQVGSQHPTLTGEILHLGRKMRAIPAQAMDEQELERSCPCDVEGQLAAVTREFHGSSQAGAARQEGIGDFGGVPVIAKWFGVVPGTVQRVSRPFEGGASAV